MPRTQIWSDAAIELLFERARAEFGPGDELAGSLPRSGPEESKWAEFDDRFNVAVGATGNGTIMQIHRALRLHAGAEWKTDLRQIASAVRNLHFAYKTGFLKPATATA